jgi:anti-sigma B factor antagonist
MGDKLQLALETREAGKVAIVRCRGRIVAGAEEELLGAHICSLMSLRNQVVLNLGKVDFVDSSGLGVMVRSVTTARQMRGDIKLCNVPETIAKVLKLTHLDKLFDLQDSEEHATAAFARLALPFEKLKPCGPSVLCIHPNPDVLAYFREVLRRAGYTAFTSPSLEDSLLVMRLTPPRVLLLNPDLSASQDTQRAFDALSASLPRIEITNHYSTIDPAEVAAGLLAQIAEQLKSHAS